MARKLIVEVVGDSRSLERTFARSTNASRKFGNEMNTSLGKAEQRFTRFQRVTAGGFVGGALAAAGITALKRIIDVSAESQQVLGQTKVALEATGKSWEQYGKQIEDTVNKQSRLGFDDEALLRTFSLFQRTTGDVNRALNLNNLAMDVARARFIDLEQAAQLVNKAALGQAGALRRLGIDAKTGADGIELLTLLNEKYGGSAAAASKDARTAMDRVSVSAENVQESIGTLLLPAVKLLADDLDAAAQSAQALVDGLHKIGSVKIPTINLPFNITIGGQSVGDLARGAAGVLKFTPLNPAFGLTIAAAIADQFRSQTKAATPALANEFARSINTMTTNALDTAAQNTATAKPPTPAFGQPGFKPINRDSEVIIGSLEQAIAFARRTVTKAIAATKAAQDAAAKTKAAQEAAQKQRVAFDKLIDAINLGVQRAAETRGFADDLRRNTQLQNAIKQQIKVEGRTTELARLLFEARRDRQRIMEQIREGAAESLQARQFRALGLGDTGEARVPGVENLRKQFDQLSKRVVAEGLTGKLVSQLKAAGKVLNGQFGKVTEETRNAIVGLFETIRGTFDQQSRQGPLTKGAAVNAGKILEGLGLTPEVEATLRARLSRLNSASGLASAPRLPRGTSTTAVSPQPVIVESHTTITLDGDVVSRAVTRSQQKRRRRNPPQRRGPNSGV